MKKSHDKEKLERFFRQIAKLTSNHDVIDNYACVTADKLGDVLMMVDDEWFKGIPPMTNKEYKAQIHTEYET